jgi:hypothetical protein
MAMQHGEWTWGGEVIWVGHVRGGGWEAQWGIGGPETVSSGLARSREEAQQRLLKFLNEIANRQNVGTS